MKRDIFNANSVTLISYAECIHALYLIKSLP